MPFSNGSIADQPLSRYLLYLEETVASLKRDRDATQQPREAINHGGGPARAGSRAGTAEVEMDESLTLAPTYGGTSKEEPEAPEWNALTNPLSSGQSMFMTSDSGKRCAFDRCDMMTSRPRPS